LDTAFERLCQDISGYPELCLNHTGWSGLEPSLLSKTVDGESHPVASFSRFACWAFHPFAPPHKLHLQPQLPFQVISVISLEFMNFVDQIDGESARVTGWGEKK